MGTSILYGIIWQRKISILKPPFIDIYRYLYGISQPHTSDDILSGKLSQAPVGWTPSWWREWTPRDSAGSAQCWKKIGGARGGGHICEICVFMWKQKWCLHLYSGCVCVYNIYIHTHTHPPIVASLIGENDEPMAFRVPCSQTKPMCRHFFRRSRCSGWPFPWNASNGWCADGSKTIIPHTSAYHIFVAMNIRFPTTSGFTRGSQAFDRSPMSLLVRSSSKNICLRFFSAFIRWFSGTWLLPHATACHRHQESVMLPTSGTACHKKCENRRFYVLRIKPKKEAKLDFDVVSDTNTIDTVSKLDIFVTTCC